MSLNTLKSALAGLLLAIGIPFSAQVQAHGGLSLADDVCKLTIGPYTMHFTGYQPEATQEKEFCEDIPATGRTVARVTEARLCRCGQSKNKPFCDLSHVAAGFQAAGA